MKLLLALGALLVSISAQAQTAAEHLLICAGPVHADIVSLSVMADMKSASDEALLNIQFQDLSFKNFATTKESFIDGYIELPSFQGVDRALVLDDNGWFVSLMTPEATEFLPTNCFEPNEL
ncbi:MAG: hypothetical protein HUU57_01140 [Bdellovibrio sp.]|nr:hypothetical protein [Bdellovibrio sp.]